MRNNAGITKQIKIGFSWTSFLFGGLPFFSRGMPIQGIFWVVLAVITLGLSNLILMFMINKQTARYYLNHGYKPVGEGWDVAGKKWGITIGSSPLIKQREKRSTKKKSIVGYPGDE